MFRVFPRSAQSGTVTLSLIAAHNIVTLAGSRPEKATLPPVLLVPPIVDIFITDKIVLRFVLHPR